MDVLNGSRHSKFVADWQSLVQELEVPVERGRWCCSCDRSGEYQEGL